MSCSNFSNSGGRIPVISSEQSKTHQPEDVRVHLQDPFLNIHQQGNSGFKFQGSYLQVQALNSVDVSNVEPLGAEKMSSDSGRERLKRYRIERAGKVWIPEVWGQEELLKDWIDCSAFDESLIPGGIISARAALVQDGKRTNMAEQSREQVLNFTLR